MELVSVALAPIPYDTIPITQKRFIMEIQKQFILMFTLPEATI